MRKILVFLVLVAMLTGLFVSVSAANSAKNVNAHATVSSDGTCQVTVTATIHLDQANKDLSFPLPKKASNVTLNGARARGRMENGLWYVDLGRVIGSGVGDFSLTFQYNLPNLIGRNEADQLQLELPLLSGFDYPVQALEFSVTLPGTVTAKPAFISGYHQANIEKDMVWTVTGATITGTAQTELKDHETLSMRLLVSEDMFPQKRIVPPNFKTVNTLLTVFALLALAYWFVFLRNLPPFPLANPLPADSYSAGELGSMLQLRGRDLSMMVLSWAQLGYLLIRLEKNGKVLLQQRMDMGNERSAAEQRAFKQLFLRRDVIDAGSLRYGQLCRETEQARQNLSDFVQKRSGNPLVFRGLAAAVGGLYGVAMAINMSRGAFLQWLLAILFGGLALLSAWYLQSWMALVYSHKRKRLLTMVVLSAAWLLVAALSGNFNYGLLLVLSQLFFGLMGAYSGRRTPAGKQAMREVVDLRRYLKTVSREQLQQTSQLNPDYFHQMMPYAIALGVDKQFARRWGKLPVGECPYVVGKAGELTRASQWRGFMQKIVGAMNAAEQRPVKEKIVTFIRLFIK